MSKVLSPKYYHLIVRPNWFIKYYIKPNICNFFITENKKILDFGCGTGSNSQLFHPKDYIGIDCDKKRISYAKSLNPYYAFRTTENDILPVKSHSIDYILIVSVLHHIPSNIFSSILKEFRRVLNSDGKIIAIEPCIYKEFPICNSFMNLFDKGKYIREEEEYLSIFHNHKYETQVHKRFNQLMLYNKIFFSASPK